MNQAHTPITTKPLCQGIAPQRRGPQKSPQAARIEHELRTCPHPLTKEELATLTGFTLDVVNRMVENIRTACNKGRRGYELESKRQGRLWAYKLQAFTPATAPTLLPKPEGTLTPAPRRSMFAGVYDGAELRPFADRPGCNDHMQHGSRRGDVVAPYSGPRPMCVGTGLGIYGPGSSTSGRARGGT